MVPNGINAGLFQIRFQSILARYKSRNFSDQISVHFGAGAKMYWNLIWKCPGFVPFGANLTHFGPKSVHPDESFDDLGNETHFLQGRYLVLNINQWYDTIACVLFSRASVPCFTVRGISFKSLFVGNECLKRIWADLLLIFLALSATRSSSWSDLSLVLSCIELVSLNVVF